MIFLELPLPLLATIVLLSSPSVSYFLTFASLSKQVKEKVENNQLVWQGLFKRDFKELPEIWWKHKELNNWKKVYEYFHANSLVLHLQVLPTQFTPEKDIKITITLQNIRKRPNSTTVAFGKRNDIRELRGVYITSELFNKKLFGFNHSEPALNILDKIFVYSFYARHFVQNTKMGIVTKDTYKLLLPLPPNREVPLQVYLQSYGMAHYLNVFPFWNGKIMSNIVPVQFIV